MSGPDHRPPPQRPGNQGIFNRISPVILIIIGFMVLMQIVFALSPSAASRGALIVQLSFIPARFTSPDVIMALSGLQIPAAATVISHLFVHLSLGELVFSAILLVIFGTPVATRFGAVRYALLVGGASAAAALLYYYLAPDSVRPLVGATAAINASVACFARFGFESGGMLSDIRIQHPLSSFIRARPLEQIFSNRRLVVFAAVWIALTMVIPLSVPEDTTASVTPLWYPRVAGFLFGLLFFDLIDPVKEGGIDPGAVEREVAAQRSHLVDADNPAADDPAADNPASDDLAGDDPAGDDQASDDPADGLDEPAAEPPRRSATAARPPSVSSNRSGDQSEE